MDDLRVAWRAGAGVLALGLVVGGVLMATGCVLLASAGWGVARLVVLFGVLGLSVAGMVAAQRGRSSAASWLVGFGVRAATGVFVVLAMATLPGFVAVGVALAASVAAMGVTAVFAKRQLPRLAVRHGG